jgi:hypothetical protein
LNKPNILLFDLECAPKVAYVWQFFKVFVQPDMVVQDGYLMTAAWKWLGANHTGCFSIEDTPEDDYELTKMVAMLLDNADVVIAHNAKKFDIPLINARCLVHGIKPPSPYKIIDTLEIARKKFRFDSNKLEYLAMRLGCKPKGGHKKFPGFLLWKECMAGNPEAWKEMVDYNINDVETLEEIYLKMRPWMDQHPNIAHIIGGNATRCAKCGSLHLQRRGTYKSNVGVYQRYQCVDCGGWSRSRFTEERGNKQFLGNAGVM